MTGFESPRVAAAVDQILAVFDEVEAMPFAKANSWVRILDQSIGQGMDCVSDDPVTEWYPDDLNIDSPFVRWAARPSVGWFLHMIDPETGGLATAPMEELMAAVIPHAEIKRCDRCCWDVEVRLNGGHAQGHIGAGILPITTGSSIVLFALCSRCVSELRARFTEPPVHLYRPSGWPIAT